MNTVEKRNSLSQVFTSTIDDFVNFYVASKIESHIKYNKKEPSIEMLKFWVKMAFKEFIIGKSGKRLTYDEYVIFDVPNALLTLIYPHISDENKDENINPFIEALINAISKLQGLDMEWIISDDEDYKERPFIKNENGYWTVLTTYKEACPVHIFRFLFEQFENSFMNQMVSKR